MLNMVKVVARDLPDLWFQALYNILKEGREHTIDSGSFAGSKRLEYDYFTGHVLKPGSRPLLPEIPVQYDIPNPVSEDYLNEYVSFLMTPMKEENTSYTYGARLTKSLLFDYFNDLLYKRPLESMAEIYYDIDNETEGDFWDEHKHKIVFRDCKDTGHDVPFVFLNQIEYVIWKYKNFGHRDNQLVLQIAKPEDIVLKDPCCLRHIDTRIQDNKLHFFVYFRSWDLWSGMPCNLAGIQLLKEYMADEIGVEDGEMVVESKGLHLYDYCIDLAKIRCMAEGR